MYKLDIPLDQKEAAAINRRKQNEEERQNRIFNARTRLIGVDKEALNHQVNDRNKMQQMDQQRHDAYAREMIKMINWVYFTKSDKNETCANFKRVLMNFGYSIKGLRLGVSGT